MTRDLVRSSEKPQYVRGGKQAKKFGPPLLGRPILVQISKYKVINFNNLESIQQLWLSRLV